jgi:hypothetical protein
MEPQPTTETSFALFCTGEWHISRLGATYAPLVYSYAMHMSKKSGRFWLSLPAIAEYFNADIKSIRKAVRALEKARFFIRLKNENSRAVSYRPLGHGEWAKRHPGCCLEKVQKTWHDEPVDPLVSRLYAASDGKLRLYTNFVTGMRRTRLSDDEIVQAWGYFYAIDEQPWRGVFGRFMQHLRDLAGKKNIADTPTKSW